jgi:hypothetical protein
MGLFSKKLKPYTEDSPYSWDNLVGCLQFNSAYEYFSMYKGLSGADLANLDESIHTVFIEGSADWKIRECFLPLTHPEFLPVSRKEGWKTLNQNSNSKLMAQFQRVISGMEVTISSAELEDGSSFFYGKWGSGNKHPFAQIGIFYRNEKGEEVLNWNAPLLSFNSLPKDELLGFVIMATKLTQPALLQSALMLAECTFPSTAKIINLSRKLSYSGDFPEKLFPKPFIDFSISSGYLKANSDTLTFVDADFVTGIGFEISDKLSDSQLQTALETVMDSFPHIFTMLEDGYINYGPESNAPFDLLTFGPGLGEETNELRWTPTTLA